MNKVMRTVRVEKLFDILDLHNVNQVKSWCKKNNVSIYQIGVIEFVIEIELSKALENSRNVELKKSNYDKT